FLQRLWEEWGIWWWIEHDGGHHRLVLCDSMGGHPPHGAAYETPARVTASRFHPTRLSTRICG
ncbi:hypothetical protein G3N57_22425, partial [Paraburkholderia sp. Se-20369]|nr:hypothetical protein [Paraburkholderia sp. Se-20369]